MSCEGCEDIWTEDRIKKIYPYRWKNANIGIVACDIHAKEVIESLNGIKEPNLLEMYVKTEGGVVYALRKTGGEYELLDRNTNTSFKGVYVKIDGGRLVLYDYLDEIVFKTGEVEVMI